MLLDAMRGLLVAVGAGDDGLDKHNRQSALWVRTALTCWWSLSLLLSHVTPHTHTRTRLAKG
jgi:hypothetical protein